MVWTPAFHGVGARRGGVVAMAMEQSQVLGAKIAGFPGYGDEDARRRSDELVRSYLGEALSDLRVRLAPLDGAVETRLDGLIQRSAVADQAAYEVYEQRARENAGLGAMTAADAGVLETADAASAVEAPDAASYLDRVAQALDARAAAMEGRVSCT